FTIFRGVYSTVPVVDDTSIIVTNGAADGQGGGAVAANTTSVSSGRQVTGVALVGKDLHQSPSYDSLILSRSVPNDPNTILPLLGASTDDAGNIWYLVNVPNIGMGWMDGVDFRALECGTDQVGIITRETPITFDGISTQDSYLLSVNTEGYLVGIRGDFVLFELLDGTVGLVNRDAYTSRPDSVVSVCSDLPGVTTSANTTGTTSSNTTATTSAVQPAVSGNHVVVNTGNLNIRSGPSAGFSVVATVPGGTELAVAGRTADGIWYFVEGNFGQGWVNSQFVLFRGEYNGVPVVGN
ncbi:MAG: SH3 domain-containing protein, partial [Anaerolineae bacterium]|nr:SH3 domain-containing protein [Anaerolineae bacterium]